MEVGILGLAASGKSTLFKLLTGLNPANARHDVPQVGIARVPDRRLQALHAMFTPRKTTPATVRYVDVPGISTDHRSEGSLALPDLRRVDALMVVLRAFSDHGVSHPLGDIDPLRDLRYLEEELILQDQVVVERRLDKVRQDLAKRRLPDLEREVELLTQCLDILEAGRPLRTHAFSADEEKRLRGFTFLSLKPILVVLNTGDDKMRHDGFTDTAWSSWMDQPQIGFTQVCATLEGELAELEDEDAQAFMTDLGVADRALDRVIRESYRLLGLASFFTVGEDECRAWSVPANTPAGEAASVIHSDIERGFIRAEVVPVDELLAAGSLAACRQRGTLRLEGKAYPVKDGEVMHFRFNV